MVKSVESPILHQSVKCAGGRVNFYRHASQSCSTEMRFSAFLPSKAEREPVPVLYWLSGLTCTEENFMIKAGAQKAAERLGLMLVAPDTSPRGLDLEGEDDSWDFGTGAGFYLNATQAPWSGNYRMYDYVAEELPALIGQHFPALPGRASIFGHSMGGHGALVIAQRNRRRYRSVSAFAPICAPTQCPWGRKAFGGYLGPDEKAWTAYDSCALLAGMDHALPMLVDQGRDDTFLAEQLKPESLREVCRKKGHQLTLRIHEGYDHSYYFIASFIDEHLAYHAEALSGDAISHSR